MTNFLHCQFTCIWPLRASFFYYYYYAALLKSSKSWTQSILVYCSHSSVRMVSNKGIKRKKKYVFISGKLCFKVIKSKIYKTVTSFTEHFNLIMNYYFFYYQLNNCVKLQQYKIKCKSCIQMEQFKFYNCIVMRKT